MFKVPVHQWPDWILLPMKTLAILVIAAVTFPVWGTILFGLWVMGCCLFYNPVDHFVHHPEDFKIAPYHAHEQPWSPGR